jgi:SAM-dependent methyltransferase
VRYHALHPGVPLYTLPVFDIHLMGFTNDFYPESRLGGFTDVDGTVAFYNRVNAMITPQSVVLDVGCGRAEYQDDPVALRRGLRIFKGKAAKVIGIDLDPVALNNPFMDEVRLIEGARWPVEDTSVDVCVADFVMEHVADPDAFFAECRRVLKPGGLLSLRTTNWWNYFTMLARLIPERLHGRVLRKAQPGRKDEDVFPKHYRCNTVSKLRAALLRHGFDGVAYGHEAEPSYLSFSRLAYTIGVLHQKFAPSFMRAAIFVHARRGSE